VRKSVEVLSYLWVEYQYRHDMVWKLAFRITAVAAALLIAPFLADQSVPEAVRYGLAGLPFLAIVVIAGGLFTLQSELGRLDLIREAYRAAQKEVLGPYVSANKLELRRVKRHKPEKRDQPEGDRQRKEHLRERLWGWFGSLHFDQRVRLYFVVLLVAASIYFVAFVGWWLPNLVDQARHSQPAQASALTGTGLSPAGACEPRFRIRSRDGITSESLGTRWSPYGARGCNRGNQRQIGGNREPQKQAKSVATGCHRLLATFHGKEGVDGPVHDLCVTGAQTGARR
jgi:uncharacterized iron-regulated membrane protein